MESWLLKGGFSQQWYVRALSGFQNETERGSYPMVWQQITQWSLRLQVPAEQIVPLSANL